MKKLFLFVAVMSCMTQPVFSAALFAAEIKVNTTEDKITSDGKCSLREAIFAAGLNSSYMGCTTGSGDDTIILPAGIYTLALVGQGSSTGDIDISEQNVVIKGEASNSTIIDGGGIDRVFEISNSNSNVTLENLTISGGNASFGGCISSEGSLTISKTTLKNCTATNIGGGIYVGGNLTISNSTIQNNTALNGGGLYIDNSVLPELTVNIEATTISDNTATNEGGGINVSHSGVIKIKTSKISGNTAKDGGGFVISGGTLEVKDSTVAANYAKEAAGGFKLTGDGKLNILNSVITNNGGDADGSGFAMWLSSNADGQTVITNTTIANNYGYAIYISANTTKALILNSTIIKNSGGIYNDDGGALVAKDTILAHNTMINCLGSLMLEGSNVIGDEGSCAVSGSGSSSFQELNSLVLAYVDSIEPGKSYFPLADKSIAINNASSGGPIYDQLGNLRDSKHDIGAIEATTTCGDGALYTSLGEECDDGSENSDTGECTTLCKNAKCGDSMVQASVETCDDGNATDGDGCNSACVSEKCGDTIVQTALGEACDDANDSNADACLSTCAAASCGDGFVQAGVEACDDGNKVDGDGCSSACAVEVAADEQKDQDKDQDKDKVDQVVGSAVVEEETGGGDGGDVNVSDGSNGGGEDVKVSDGNAEPAKAGSSGGCSLIR